MGCASSGYPTRKTDISNPTRALIVINKVDNRVYNYRLFVTDTTLSIAVDSVTFGGVKYRASAECWSYIWNYDTKQVSFNWRLKVFGRDGSLARTEPIVINVDNNAFVFEDSGEPIPEGAEVVTEKDAATVAGKKVVSKYSFYKSVSEKDNSKFNELVKQEAEKRKSLFKL